MRLNIPSNDRPGRQSARLVRAIEAVFFSLVLSGLTNSSSAQHYYAYVASESADEVSLIHFEPSGDRATSSRGSATVAQRIPVGVWPSEIEGPHGITVSPDGQYWFVTMAHGNPYGALYKYETRTNRLVGRTDLGLFPATMVISAATGLLYAANFNLHGDMMPGTVSIVDPLSMTELAKVTTGVMPHGSRLSPDGLKQYSVSMMDGQLHEMDAITFAVIRSLKLDLPIDQQAEDVASHNAHSTSLDNSKMIHSQAKPTWVAPSPNGQFVYVALNGMDRIAEVSLDSWSIVRELPTGAGPYNVAVSSDGKTLVVTNKKDGTTGVLDLDSGAEIARIKNTRTVPHGVLITPDDRFAFVSVEGVGAQPGSVDVIELSTRELVASVDVGTQAGGIYFWSQSDTAKSLGSNR